MASHMNLTIGHLTVFIFSEQMIQWQFTLVLKKIKTIKIELPKSRHSGKSYTNETSSFVRFALFAFANELCGKQSIDENETFTMINTYTGFLFKGKKKAL